jgi:hypothetical protein
MVCRFVDGYMCLVLNRVDTMSIKYGKISIKGTDNKRIFVWGR